MKPNNVFAAKAAFIFSFVFFATGIANSQTLPTAKTIAAEMGLAWSLGNNMEIPDGPTAWGNPMPSQELIDMVKANGFNTIRIPCAWDTYADPTTLVIDTAWMNQVKEVVDFCFNAGCYVILNSHWDGGWLEDNVEVNKQEEVNTKQHTYWTQIATFFKEYDHHLVFAGANEPACSDPYGLELSAERMAIILSYIQTFIDAVRATGGNNASRTLVYPAPKGNIELAVQHMTTLPTDNIDDRLMAEFHFYPYQFTQMEVDEDWGKVFYYWGRNNHSTTDTDRNPTWGEEGYVDTIFDIAEDFFVDRNIPVIIGEFGAKKRTKLTGETLIRHIKSRRDYYTYVVSAALQRGMVPVVWDNGFKGNLTFSVFNRQANTVYDLGLLNAIRAGGGMEKLPGDTSYVKVIEGNQSMKILYSAKDSLWGQIELGVEQADMSTVDSVIVRAYLNGETSYTSGGTQRYGWVSMSLVTMSNDWTWREASLGELTMDDWTTYSVPMGTDTTDETALVPADPANIDFFAIHAYSEGYRGTIYIDWIVFKSKSGVSDTVYSFNQYCPEQGTGNMVTVGMFPTIDVPTDTEWDSVTIRNITKNVITRHTSKVARNLEAYSAYQNVVAAFTASDAGIVKTTLRNLQGRTIVSRSFHAKAGLNTLTIPVHYHGVMIVEIRQKGKKFIGKVIGY